MYKLDLTLPDLEWNGVARITVARLPARGDTSTTQGPPNLIANKELLCLPSQRMTTLTFGAGRRMESRDKGVNGRCGALKRSEVPVSLPPLRTPSWDPPKRGI